MIRRNWIIILIILVASLLRFIGTNPGYNRYHNDEPIIYGTAIDMVRNNSLDPVRFDYPGGPIYINYFAFKFVFIPFRWGVYYTTHVLQILDGTVHIPISALEKDRIFNTFILGGRDFYPLFWGRYVVSFFGVGNVFLLYVLGKKLFSKNVGLIAALLLAINFRQILNSHIDLPDIYNSFFLLLSFITAVSLWKKPILKNYFFAGAAFGLSFSMKYQFFGVLPIMLAHTYTSFESRKFLKTFFNLNVLFAVFTSILVFMIFNPYFFVRFELARFWIESVSARYGVGVNTLSIYPISYLYHYDYGAVESFVILAGLILGILKYFRKSILLLAAIFPFMASLLYFSRGGFYVRNFVTITPLFLLFAALFISSVYQFIKKRTGGVFSALILIIILVFVGFVPARNSIIHTYYYTKPWGYQVLSDWLYKNLPPNSIVAANPFDPPTGSPPLRKTEFELSGSYSLAEHRDDGADYALSNSDWTANAFFFWMSYGFSDLKRFWNKPIDILRNTFFGLAIEEHFRYRIFAATKVWQSPDEALVLAKIPVWPKVKFNNLVSFRFDKDMEGWTTMDKEIDGGADYIYDSKNGHGSEGSIVYLPLGSKYSIVRAASKPIGVTPGYLYKVTGFLKSEEVLDSRNRNGFLRVDFYSANTGLQNVGIVSSISSRLYGTGDWMQKEVVERAPDGAKYMTVSFQMSGSTTGKIWLDDVNVYVSDTRVDDITSKAPYDSSKKIDLDLLYTNSHANL